eukprot:6146779-Prymnesium_polylepis.2
MFREPCDCRLPARGAELASRVHGYGVPGSRLPNGPHTGTGGKGPRAATPDTASAARRHGGHRPHRCGPVVSPVVTLTHSLTTHPTPIFLPHVTLYPYPPLPQSESSPSPSTSISTECKTPPPWKAAGTFQGGGVSSGLPRTRPSKD